LRSFVAGFIDVFAEMAFGGNPLAVVEDADSLSEDIVRRVAGEFNQAETTFLMKSNRADWKLRSFTANGSEVFGAGHNALGAWLWLGYQGRLGDLTSPRTFKQEIGSHVLPITLEKRGGQIFGKMTQAPLRLGKALDDLSALAEALGLTSADLLVNPAVRAADTGAAHLMVRVRDSRTVDLARPNAQKLLAVLRSAGAEGCYIYAIDQLASPKKAYARFFNPTVGLWEDAATGTAAGPLCAYLGRLGMLDSNGELTVEQGTHMGRQSILRLCLTPAVELSGSGVMVFVGSLTI
jgi:PhzF family phenazine biosynthesis protein